MSKSEDKVKEEILAKGILSLEISELKAEIERAKNREKQLKADLKAANDKHEKYDEMWAQGTADLKETQSQLLIASKSEKDQLAATLKALASEKDTLESDLRAAEAQASTESAAHKRVALQLTTAEHELATLKANTVPTSHMNAELLRQQASDEARVVAVNAKLKTAEQLAADAEAKLATAEAAKSALETAAASGSPDSNLVSSLQTEAATYKLRVTQLEGQVLMEQQQVTDTEGRRNILQLELDALKRAQAGSSSAADAAAVAALRFERDTLQAQLDSVKANPAGADAAALAAFAAQVANLQRGKHSVELNLAAAEATMRSLEAEKTRWLLK